MSIRVTISADIAFVIGAIASWAFAFPCTLTFQEQNQLFLFSWSFLVDRLALAGGFAMWISEFLVQFFLYPFAGAIIMAGLGILVQKLVWKLAPKGTDEVWFPLSFVPSVLVFLSFGDVYSLLSQPVALTLTLIVTVLFVRGRLSGFPLLFFTTAVLYWTVGPVFWLFVALLLFLDYDRKKLLILPWALLLHLVSFFIFMRQYPLMDVLCGVTYYRLPLSIQPFQFAAAFSCLVIPVLFKLCHPGFKPLFFRPAVWLIVAVAAVSGAVISFHRDTYTIVALDQLVREEKWDKLLSLAQKRPVKSDLYSVAVNLALFMTSRTDEAEKFYQSGRRGLILPRIRDFISNTSSYEVFWRLGMVNSCLRYAFDSQESLVNNQKSGRHLSRMAECHIVNGNYQIAEKYLNILSKTLFYRKFARSRIEMIAEGVERDPMYSYLRQIRFRDDFFYYYPEMGKMLARLYFQNNNNQMSAYYYQRWVSYSE